MVPSFPLTIWVDPPDLDHQASYRLFSRSRRFPSFRRRGGDISEPRERLLHEGASDRHIFASDCMLRRRATALQLVRAAQRMRTVCEGRGIKMW